MAEADLWEMVSQMFRDVNYETVYSNDVNQYGRRFSDAGHFKA